MPNTFTINFPLNKINFNPTLNSGLKFGNATIQGHTAQIIRQMCT